ncbi:MAG: DUF4263 domain-containing protein [Anaerolineae bacterium]|nr:DUF4263 domain-containing protein [Anaerolineae bacterium]
MTDRNSVYRGKQILEELSLIIQKLTDSEVAELLGTGLLDNLLKAILDPSERSNYPNLNEFLLANKTRATLLAVMRYALTHNYSFRGQSKDGKYAFISPSHVQWFDDGVMFMQGEEPFEGLIGLYRQDKRLSYAVLSRDAHAGETIGPDHFEFIDETEFRERWKEFSKTKISKLDEPIQRLEALLNNRDNDESHYQELLTEYPWILGAEYEDIQRHTKLDDKNIPDFTGGRVRDGCRDLIEIKPPFTKVSRGNGDLNNAFNDAWNQAERYLDFAKSERGYLQRKGFRFDNPKCYLILGFDLTDDELKQVRIKERNNPAIHLLTYNDLLAFTKATVTLIRSLKAQETEVENTESASSDAERAGM